MTYLGHEHIYAFDDFITAEDASELIRFYEEEFVWESHYSWVAPLEQFNKGPVIGLNAQILKDFVDYTAANALKEIGIKYQEPAPRSTPIPWFNNPVDTSKKQTALQENESTNYVIGVMSDAIDYDELPEL